MIDLTFVSFFKRNCSHGYVEFSFTMQITGQKATKGERKLCHSSEAFEGQKKIHINLECRTFIAYSGWAYLVRSSGHQRTGRGGWGGCSPPCREKNSIIRAKLMYHSGKDTVRWDTCCSERQLTTDGKRPLSYHSLLHMYWQSRQWTSIKVWGQWPGGFVRIGWNRIQPFSKHQQHPNCIKFLWRG